MYTFLHTYLQAEILKIASRNNKKISLYMQLIHEENQKFASKLKSLITGFNKKKEVLLGIIDKGHIDFQSINPIEKAIGKLKLDNSLRLEQIVAIGRTKKEELTTMTIIDDIKMIVNCFKIINRSSIGSQHLKETDKEAVKRALDLDLMKDIHSTLSIPTDKLYANLSNINILNENTRRSIYQVQSRKGILSLAFSPCGRYITTGDAESFLKLWNTKTGKILQTIKSHENAICSIDYSPCGRYLASASQDSSVKLWEIQTGTLLYTMDKHRNSVYSVKFSPCGSYLISGGSDKNVCFWKFDNHQEPHYIHSYNSLIKTLAFSPCGNYFAAGVASSFVYIWKTVNFEMTTKYRIHDDTVHAIQFSPSGRFIVSAALDRRIKIFDLTEQQVFMDFPRVPNSVVTLSISPCGNFVVSAHFDKRVQIREIYTGHVVYNSNLYKSSLKAVSFSPNGKYIAVGEVDNILLVSKVSDLLNLDE